MPWTWVGPDGHEGIILAHKEINFASEKSTTVADNVEEQIIPVPPSAPLMANSTDELGEVVKKEEDRPAKKKEDRPAKKNIFWAMGCIKKYHRGVDIISYGDYINLRKCDLTGPLLADEPKMSMSSRYLILEQCLLSLIDALCIVPGVVVVGTLWRASKISSVLAKVVPLLRSWRLSLPIESQVREYNRIIFHVWACCAIHFVLLILDILCSAVCGGSWHSVSLLRPNSKSAGISILRGLAWPGTLFSSK